MVMRSEPIPTLALIPAGRLVPSIHRRNFCQTLTMYHLIYAQEQRMVL
jgi:hypothetical protein